MNNIDNFGIIKIVKTLAPDSKYLILIKLLPFHFNQTTKMKRTTVLLSIIFFSIISSCHFNQPKQPAISGSLFIIGGGSRPPELVNRMIKEAGLNEKGYVVILPMASALADSAIIWSGEQFLENGLQDVAGFNFEANQPVKTEWLDSIRNASLIFISGGDQNKFMEIVGGTEIATAISDAYTRGAMIAGTSAGAAVMSHLMITGNELRNPEYTSTFKTIESNNLELSNGLGFIQSAIIDQHFIWRSRHNRLLTAVIENPEMMGIGIDESTAILVKGNMAEVVGSSQVVVFSNPERSFTENNGKIGARNIRLDIYLPGEIFALN
jgi:cyanophycinase